MMRPMKLAGSQLLFGTGCIAFLKTIETKRAVIVTGGNSMKRSGMLDRVNDYLTQAGAETTVFEGVEPDPTIATVLRGAALMQDVEPDLIVALGGGSVMDAAKGMWVYYEHPELTTLEDVLNADPFPLLRFKARFCCIPSTSGTASEVSRSFVLSDENGIKHGFGNMEMMPDIAICDPEVTASMPPRVTAETGMDALTHALEALVSNRANYLSDLLVRRAIVDIYATLPEAYANGENITARETMLNASMIAGMAFTNVSLGIVHSIAHVVGGLFGISHGLADAIILPYVIEYNAQNPAACALYAEVAASLGGGEIAQLVRGLNKKLGIPDTLGTVIPDRDAFNVQKQNIAQMALADGCTKTNPVIPTPVQLEELLERIYSGTEVA